MSNTDTETGSELIVSKEVDISSNESISIRGNKESSVATIKAEAVIWCVMASIVLLIIICDKNETTLIVCVYILKGVSS